MALSREERIALLKRLEKRADDPKLSEKQRGEVWRTYRLLSNLIAYSDRKNGKPYSPYWRRVH